MQNIKQITIDGHTRLCGLIGNPVEHTLSPAIHNTLAAIYGHNLVYVPFRVEKGFLQDAVRGAYALNVLGMNVTVPYKTDVMECLCGIDPIAEKIGAVNTLVRTEGGFKGYNTDILGLKRALDVNGAVVKGKTAVVLGAGGAARSAAFLCEDLGAEKVYVLNRSADRAEALADEVNRSAGEKLVRACSLDKADKMEEDEYIVIQATSVGLSPHDSEAVVYSPEFYKKVSFGFDMVYRPAETMFMKFVKQYGGKCSNGLPMLLYQGVIAYELMNGVSVDEETASEVINVLESMVRA